MEKNLKNTVFAKDTVEFVTVSVQYCAFLENFENLTSADLTDRMIKLLPLLYLKANLLPKTEIEADSDHPDIVVTEEYYNYILLRLQHVFGENDSYLEVFLDDMKYSETPILANISEDLTDIYQDLKNFITVYEQGIEENMNDALHLCHQNFKLYWGQKLVNVLRALHSLHYSEEVDEDEYNTEDQW